MGFPMARNMAKAGIRVRAWNRSREKAEPLEQDGATVCDTPAEACEGAGIVLTMLADADAVLESAKDALREGVLWLQMSTVGEAGTERCLELAREKDVTFLDAPVLGTKGPAQDGKLVVLASGPESERERVQAIFDAVGQKTIWVDQEPGASTRLKVVVNSWVLTVTEATAEMIALAQATEVDPQLILDAIEGGTLDLPYLRIKSKAILEHNFEPMFSLKLAAKDAGLIEESAERHGIEVPLFSTVRSQMSKAAKDHGDEDMSATYFATAK
jgi:3-hydroxyisobutyrate dehydrogenase